MTTAPELSLDTAVRRWGTRKALVDVSLTIEPGARIALIGPSGGGKTTLLRLLMAALRPSAGSVRVDGINIAAMTPAAIRAHRRRCGLIDQGALVIPRLSVHDNVIAGTVAQWPWWRTLISMAWSVDRSRVHALLAEVGIADRQFDRADELSGGQQQRVAIARALAGAPSILLADEPTAALDRKAAANVVELLVRQTSKRGATLVVSTHHVSQVAHIVDRIVGLRDGHLVLDEPPNRITDAALGALYEGSSERA